MDADQVALAVAALALAGVVKGAAGIGFSTTALPLLALTIGLKSAMPLVILPSLASNFLVMADAAPLRETFRAYAPLYAASLPGIALGLVLLRAADPSAAGGVLGAVLATYAALSLGGVAPVLSATRARLLRIPVGAATGLVNGLTGSQVMPLVPFLLSTGVAPGVFVQASNISFTISSLAMIVGLASIDLLTWPVAALSAACVVPGSLGVLLGNRIRRAMPVRAFRVLVLLVLLAMGGLLLLRAFAP
jgi:uncharacterized membrane protein YfcA